MKPSDLCLYYGLLTVSLLLSLLPERLARACGNFFGRMFMALSQRRRDICRQNLRRAGYDEALCRSVFQHLGRLLVSFLRMRHAIPDALMRNVDVVGFENYQKARETADSVILASAHLGNWEKMAWAHAYLSGRPGRVVARAADQPGADRFLEEVRMLGGFSVLEKKVGIRGIIKELKKGIDLGVLIDQKVKPSMGVPVPFFGERVPALPIVPLLARATGAAIVPVFLGEEADGRETIHYLPEIKPTGDDAEDTKVLTGHIEEYIRRYPDQWYWIHNRWRYATPIDQPCADNQSASAQNKPDSQ